MWCPIPNLPTIEICDCLPACGKFNSIEMSHAVIKFTHVVVCAYI